MLIQVPVSVGDLVDRVTILRVKAERIGGAKRANVEREKALLEGIVAGALPDNAELAALTGELQAVNALLWDVEDGKRECERLGEFGPRFVALARAVYRENDRRAAIKRRINLLTGSDLVEEKSHALEALSA